MPKKNHDIWRSTSILLQVQDNDNNNNNDDDDDEYDDKGFNGQRNEGWT